MGQHTERKCQKKTRANFSNEHLINSFHLNATAVIWCTFTKTRYEIPSVANHEMHFPCLFQFKLRIKVALMKTTLDPFTTLTSLWTHISMNSSIMQMCRSNFRGALWRTEVINGEGHQKHLLSDALRLFSPGTDWSRTEDNCRSKCTLGKEQLGCVRVHRSLNVVYLSLACLPCVDMCWEHTQYNGSNQCICSNYIRKLSRKSIFIHHGTKKM